MPQLHITPFFSTPPPQPYHLVPLSVLISYVQPSLVNSTSSPHHHSTTSFHSISHHAYTPPPSLHSPFPSSPSPLTAPNAPVPPPHHPLHPAPPQTVSPAHSLARSPRPCTRPAGHHDLGPLADLYRGVSGMLTCCLVESLRWRRVRGEAKVATGVRVGRWAYTDGTHIHIQAHTYTHAHARPCTHTRKEADGKQ